MNLKTVTLSFLLGATTATMLGSMAPKAEASTPQYTPLQRAQYSMCVTGRTYKGHINNGLMDMELAVDATTRNIINLQQENGWGAETNTALLTASNLGFSGGSCGLYLM